LDPDAPFNEFVIVWEIALMHENIMVYLVGFSGTGKLTVARELAPLLKAKIVDNHWINNPIFGLLDNDRTTPFPEGVWDQVARVRQAVLDTIATLSAPAANFILTHAGFDDDPEDQEIYDIIVKTAERRRAVFVPVRLLCEEAELVRRVISPEGPPGSKAWTQLRPRGLRAGGRS
jgi:hypothetical protein